MDPGFRVGRFDVRFESPENLRPGESFPMFWISCGISGPLHARDAASRPPDVWRARFRQIDLIHPHGRPESEAASSHTGFAALPAQCGAKGRQLSSSTGRG